MNGAPSVLFLVAWTLAAASCALLAARVCLVTFELGIHVREAAYGGARRQKHTLFALHSPQPDRDFLFLARVFVLPPLVAREYWSLTRAAAMPAIDRPLSETTHAVAKQHQGGGKDRNLDAKQTWPLHNRKIRDSKERAAYQTCFRPCSIAPWGLEG